MVAVPIATGRTPAELRALARRERDGRVGARLPALAHAPGGVSRGEAAGGPGPGRRGPPAWTGSPCATGSTATTRKGSRACATGRGPADPAPWTRAGRRP